MLVAMGEWHLGPGTSEMPTESSNLQLNQIVMWKYYISNTSIFYFIFRKTSEDDHADSALTFCTPGLHFSLEF